MLDALIGGDGSTSLMTVVVELGNPSLYKVRVVAEVELTVDVTVVVGLADELDLVDD